MLRLEEIGEFSVITARDPERPGRLLLAERETLLPMLRRTPESHFDRPTSCPDWTVREVLAHCGAALVRIVEGRLPGFTPENNAADVRERRDWPLGRVLDELERGMIEAGPVIAAAEGELDVIALGEWVHAGDVREALGRPGAYESVGMDDALALLSTVSRERSTPRVHASTPIGGMVFGNVVEGRAPARLEADPGTVIRMYCGRPADPARYRLSGATDRELVIYG
ncbi:maleylpyruvate isomerase family mycothiol-dependent enzyme [Saccharothrix sp. ST-888]|uniref:maleylpyruvate isomerase family mycothiol-dependent enzyme n=1 Tax=Saccharothrix sp. ST-888 TaxID=1427391 RepID=UPI0005ED38F5|nr:maleylpyruvate isomerase family mycothiol-dependent enzyme [Saccharothrix sp. ST-888]